ncbi:cell surface protein [Lactobacillus paraplantarum]|uniref:Cell surface protein n=1 Tax=Lactiplantibacillus paraplantarum TaxID=60520 RepID=A0A4Q9XY90_9LACO|nr:cell surface protein [Lactiplantibacillus paraplantarum]
MRQISIAIITAFMVLIMLPVFGLGAVGGRSTVAVDFYAGQHTRQQVDDQQLNIPNGIKPYHVVSVRIHRKLPRLPQTSERPVLWSMGMMGLALLVVLAAYRHNRRDIFK